MMQTEKTKKFENTFLATLGIPGYGWCENEYLTMIPCYRRDDLEKLGFEEGDTVRVTLKLMSRKKRKKV